MTIAAATLLQRGNPLDIQWENFGIAVDVETKRTVGWAQIRLLSATAATDPNRFDDSNAGSRSIERDDVEETLWEEFEDEKVPFPNGFASLPWTKEYRQAMQAGESRRNRRAELLELEMAQQQPLWEMSSIFVDPKWRGNGIGSELVTFVLNMHSQNKDRVNSTPLESVYAVAPARQVSWYLKLGFNVVRPDNDIPEALLFPVEASRFISKFVGEELLCVQFSAAALRQDAENNEAVA